MTADSDGGDNTETERGRDRGQSPVRRHGIAGVVIGKPQRLKSGACDRPTHLDDSVKRRGSGVCPRDERWQLQSEAKEGVHGEPPG